MFTQKCLFLAMSIFMLSACNNASNSPAATSTNTGAVVELPATVLGIFTGTLMGTADGSPLGTPCASQFANATVVKQGADVSISFSGGIPVADTKCPSIHKLQFVAASGNGEFDSTAGNGSVAGAHLASYKTNLNIENIDVGGIKIIYTGVKCDVAPESPLCTCVTNPNNLMCQNK